MHKINNIKFIYIIEESRSEWCYGGIRAEWRIADCTRALENFKKFLVRVEVMLSDLERGRVKFVTLTSKSYIDGSIITSPSVKPFFKTINRITLSLCGLSVRLVK